MDNKFWYISPSNQDDNYGINGYGAESSQMYALAFEMTPHMERCGLDFIIADFEKNLTVRGNESNDAGCGNYLALHSNAGGGGAAWGHKAFYYSAGKGIADAIHEELDAIGQESNRWSPVQYNDLIETRYPNAPSCLLEVDFHDSAIGVDFIMKRRGEIAVAIVKAMCKVSGVAWVDPSPIPSHTPAGDKLYRVQVGSFRVKGNAEKLLQKLKGEGYDDAFISEVEK